MKLCILRATLANHQAVHGYVQVHQPCLAVYMCTNLEQLCIGLPTLQIRV